MSEPRIVTPQEAREAYDAGTPLYRHHWHDAAWTIATEPDRTRAAVVKALRDAADQVQAGTSIQNKWTVENGLRHRADEIENGADW